MDDKDNCVVSPGKEGERPNIKTNKLLTKVVHHKSKMHAPQVSNCTTGKKMKQPTGQNLQLEAAKRNNPSQNVQPSAQKKEMKKLKVEDQDEDIFERKRAEHHYTLEQRSALKEFIAYENPDLRYHDIPSSPFARNSKIAENFRLISYQQAPVKNLVVCKECKHVLVRYPTSTTNLLQHLKRHSSREKGPKDDKTFPDRTTRKAKILPPHTEKGELMSSEQENIKAADTEKCEDVSTSIEPKLSTDVPEKLSCQQAKEEKDPQNQEPPCAPLGDN